MTPSSDIAFTPTVKAIQERKGSRAGYKNMEDRGGWRKMIDDDLRDFLAQQTSFFMATANAGGQPYIQHRGGPKGFIRVLDEQTLAFVDFRGNRQYITQGNLQDNPQAHLFFIDYAHQRRIKVWGAARVVESDSALISALMPDTTKAKAEQVILFTVKAWDINCPQHIPQKIDAEDVIRLLAEKDNEIAALKARLGKPPLT